MLRFKDLLPVAAGVNLDTALRLQRMKELMETRHEVAINLDQNVCFQAGLGSDFSNKQWNKITD